MTDSTDTAPPTPKVNPFSQLGLRESVVKILVELGYEAPTPIQERTIPVLLAGGDVIGQAQTGTGKTAAFALPMLERIDPESRATQALVLTPTRELAMQVAEAIHSYARGIGSISVLPVYGGAPMGTQLRALQRGAQIVVGTPGRLIDHLDRKTLNLSAITMIVLDEADEMLKMGFQEEVERILSEAGTERQVALFSATMPAEVLRISKRYLKNPTRIEIEHRAQTTPAIEQRFLNISEGQKLEVLTQILEIEPSEAVLIFRRTKNGAAELSEKLQARGFAAEAMHGDMTQPLRESVIRRLRAGQLEIVVATDVAARGLDVEQISHVINYDIPHDVEAYVHRIGRTGRAGRRGLATLFITPRERRMMREIERFTGTQIKPMKLPTRADVAAKRVALFKDNLRKSLNDGDLDLYVELVEQLVDEGGFDMAEVAAAAARLANSSRSLVAEPEPPQIFERVTTASVRPSSRPKTEWTAPPADARTERPPRPSGRDQGERPSHASYEPVSERRPPRRDDDGEPKVRLSMGVGKQDGIRPADIVGSIANEADVPGRDIGPIEIGETMTIVVIPARYRDQVLAKVAGARFRGRPLNVREASPSSGTEGDSNAPRKTYKAERPLSRPGAAAPRASMPYGRPNPRAQRDDSRPSSSPPDRKAFRSSRTDSGARSGAPSSRPYKRDDAKPGPRGGKGFFPGGGTKPTGKGPKRSKP